LKGVAAHRRLAVRPGPDGVGQDLDVFAGLEAREPDQAGEAGGHAALGPGHERKERQLVLALNPADEAHAPYLRLGPGEAQVWGVRFVRWIERKNELALFPFVARTESGMASRFASLVGLAGLETRKHIQILPYAVGTGTYRQPTVRGNPFETPSAYQRSVGAD